MLRHVQAAVQTTVNAILQRLCGRHSVLLARRYSSYVCIQFPTSRQPFSRTKLFRHGSRERQRRRPLPGRQVLPRELVPAGGHAGNRGAWMPAHQQRPATAVPQASPHELTYGPLPQAHAAPHPPHAQPHRPPPAHSQRDGAAHVHVEAAHVPELRDFQGCVQGLDELRGQALHLAPQHQHAPAGTRVRAGMCGRRWLCVFAENSSKQVASSACLQRLRQCVTPLSGAPHRPPCCSLLFGERVARQAVGLGGLLQAEQRVALCAAQLQPRQQRGLAHLWPRQQRC